MRNASEGSSGWNQSKGGNCAEILGRRSGRQPLSRRHSERLSRRHSERSEESAVGNTGGKWRQLKEDSLPALGMTS
jgi:hypothetical protein